MYGTFVGIQIVAILLAFIAIALIINMDGSNAQKMMVCFMIGVLVQNAGNLFEALSTEASAAVVAIKLQYLGACFVPLFFSQFMFLYCNQYIPKSIFKGLGIIDLLLLLSVWTCDRYPLFYETMEFVTTGDHPHFVFTYGLGFWLFIFCGALFPFGLSVWALVRSLMEDYYHGRKKHYLFFIALAAIPVATLLLRASQQMKNYDLVPPILAIVLSSVVILVWSRRNYNLSRTAAETVLHEIRDGVLFLDDEQKIAGYNTAMQNIFHDLNKTMVGKKVTKIHNFPEEIILADGTREFQMEDRHFEGHMEPVIDTDKTKLGYIIIIFDITQRKRLIMESIEMRERAEAANKAKTEFIATMSHEMRTPMNAIVGFAELIKEESLGRKVYQYACDIKSASGRLLEIFNNIWDISSAEAGKMDFVKKDYSLKRLLRDVSDKASAAAKEKGLIYKQDINDSLPIGLYGDDSRIRQVLDNLMDNAVKFTEKGTVSMTVDGKHFDDDQIMMKFIVKDTGIGIKETDLKKIFYNFEQVDSGETRIVEGVGLGLSVAKNILELMGGRLEVASVYGEGSTFTVLVPQKVTDNRKLIEMAGKGIDPMDEIVMFSAPESHILVVDDNLINRQIVKGMLKSYGLRLDEAENGFEAIELVKKQKYDIIFMDHMMPKMDGVETTKIIREQCGENGATAVIVALTANAMKGIKEMFLSHGFQDFLTKPIDKLPLHKVLSKWIPDDKKQNMKVQSVTEEINFEEIEEIFIKGIDIKKALKQHTGGLNEYVDILKLFYIDGLRKLKYLQTLVEEADFKNYRIEVHALKSASANIGAQKLSEQAELLELAEDDTFILNNHDALLEDYEKLLNEIKNVLDRLKEKEALAEPVNTADTKQPLSAEDIDKALKEALNALEHFRSKVCKDKVEWLLDHQLDGQLRQDLLFTQSKLQLYEDDDAEDLLRGLIQRHG